MALCEAAILLVAGVALTLGGKDNSSWSHAYEHHENEHLKEWTYDAALGSYGPRDWGNVSEYCQGRAQSPINLDTRRARKRRARKHRGGPSLSFAGYQLVTAEDTKLENNGHSVELELTSVPVPGAAMMSGGPLAKPYQLTQLHFHWGSSDTQGSEHTVDNKRFPMEMHLVHLASDIEWGVGSATDPVNIPDGLAVAAFLWEITEDDNPDLQGLVERMYAVKSAPSETELYNAKFNVYDLISPVISGPYFSYHGSLTTPGCNEVVHWINFRNTLKVSSRQLQQFRRLQNTVGQPLMDNYRPIQSTNNRVVTIYK